MFFEWVQARRWRLTYPSLPDYLTYHATSSLARSNCSLACKYSYIPPGTRVRHQCNGGEEEVSKDGWSARFFNKIGTGRHVTELTLQASRTSSTTTLTSSVASPARTASCLPQASLSARVLASPRRLTLVSRRARLSAARLSTRELAPWGPR